MKTNIYFWLYFAHFFLEWEMSQTKVAEKIKTHILCKITFLFFENLTICEKIWKKYCRAAQATDDNTAHAYWVQDT
jgi:hypothetical protein